ncbi:MAG: dicarboxylate/amino acid:cation symporter [Gemmatimonadetes bacterium]|nr:dicarboxylate/amino acid:cation symporter [Gemmatimonadota bacterium]
MSRPHLALHGKILLGLVLGTLAGVVASGLWEGSTGLERVIVYVAQPVGQIFLRMLLMVVVPLVFTTLVLGIAGLGDLRRLGRMGAKTLGFFVATTCLAAVLGLLVVNIVRPGEAITPALRAALLDTFAPQASAVVAVAGTDLTVDTFVNIVPANPVAAAAQGDLLSFIFFTIVFAVAVTRLPAGVARPVLEVLEGVAQAVMMMIGFAMRLAPYGVAGLTFAVTARFGLDLFAPLGKYFFAVLLGLVAYQFGLFAVLVRVLGGMSPRAFYRHARLPMLTAFSTASSSATLPTTIRAAEEGLGVPREVAGFVLPLGATLHMNGTAFFEAITVLFLAQAFGVDLSLAMQGLVVVLTVLTAVSAAGIPSGSIPLIVVMLTTVGVPGEAIALIMGVEAILGMARTSTNVTGDLLASLVIARSEALPREADGT